MEDFSPYGREPEVGLDDDSYHGYNVQFAYASYEQEKKRKTTRKKRAKRKKDEIEKKKEKKTEKQEKQEKTYKRNYELGDASSQVQYSQVYGATKKSDEKSNDNSSTESDSDDDSFSSSFSSTSDEDEEEGEGGPYIDSDMVKIPEEVSIFSSQYHWCQRFGPLTEAIQSKFIPLARRAELMRSLAALEEEFIRAATMYGKVIICERFLPNDKKTIQPINVGGKAGGIKYVIEGILFKFAWDSEGIYGGDLKAMKCASHELKGLREIFMHLPEGLRVPLMVSIDYRGFKLLAMCLLPVSKTSLIYGSADGGKTVKADDEIINKKMEELGRTLNLKRHLSGVEEQKQIYMPADIEVHKGMDGKYYMLDFARLWPPELPTPGVKASFLIRLLRGELVQGFDKPLCSDAFSQFQRGDETTRRENNQDVVDALSHLLLTIIPSLVQELEDTISDPKIIEDFDIAMRMHDRGVNMRHLGMLYVHFKNSDWKKRVLTEASVRVAKTSIQSLMRKSMKTIHMVSDEPYNRVVVGFLNFLCGNSEESRNYWNKALRWTLERNFFYVEASRKALKEVKDIKESVYMWKLFNTLLPKLGITPQPGLLTRVHRSVFFERATIMDERDILLNSPIVDSGLAEHPKAFLLYQQAFYHLDTEEQLAKREELLLQTITILRRTAVRQSPDHFLTFQYWSKALIALSEEKFKEALKDYVAFTHWILDNKVGECSSEKIFFEFLMDYFWMVLALSDRILNLTKMGANYLHRRGWQDSVPFLGKFQHPALVALMALPNADILLSKGIPFVLKWFAHNGKFTLDDEEGDRVDGLFDEIHLLGFRWMRDEEFLQLADWLCRIGKKGKLKTLRLHQMECITSAGVYAFLERMECQESLECFDHAQDIVLDVRMLCKLCPNLHSLTLLTCYEEADPDWLPILIEGMPNLRDLDAFLSLPHSYADRKDTLLSRLRSFRCKRPGDLFSVGYTMPHMESIGSYALPTSGVIDLSGAPSLRRISFQDSSSYSTTVVGSLWESLVRDCPLIEELDMPAVRFSLKDIQLLANSSTIANNVRRLSLQRVHVTAEEGYKEEESRAFHLLGTKFPNVRHLSIQISNSYVSIVHLFSTPPPPPSSSSSSSSSDTSAPPVTAVPMPPPPPLEALYTSAYTIEDWLEVLPRLKGSLKVIRSLPDFHDNQVDALLECIPPCLTALSMLSCVSLSVGSLCRIVAALPKLERVGLPCNVGDLQCVLPFLSPSVREVTVLARYNKDDVLCWDRVYQMRKELPLLICIKGSWDHTMKVKSTRALGTQSDTIDPFDTIYCLSKAPDGNKNHLLDCLQRIQRYQWSAHYYYHDD